MKPASTSTDGSGTGLTGLGTCLSAKKNHMNSVYFHGASHKKPKRPVVDDTVDLSAGPFSVGNLVSTGVKPVMSWGSEVNSVACSASGLSNVENIKNIIVKKTSYVNSDTSFKYENMDNTTPKKTQTHTYMLGHPPKQSLFDCISDDDGVLELLPCKKTGSNQMPLSKLYALVMCSFNSTKFFALDIELSVVPGKSINDKLISIKKIFYRVNNFGDASTLSKFPEIIRSSFTFEFSMNRAKKLTIHKKIVVNDNFRKVSSHLDKKIIVKEIPVNLSKSAVKSVFSKFEKIVSIKMQLIGLWQKALVEFESSEIADLVMAR
ncbi:hypothetical protein G9A89_001658 [Geosiphon pyriformis]|nr:hypothetical protein G9A89_001658 [Geosiphon pyriformis]